MANENDVLTLVDSYGDKLQARGQHEGVWLQSSWVGSNEQVTLVFDCDKVRELRDFLTAKLEGDDDRD